MLATIDLVDSMYHSKRMRNSLTRSSFHLGVPRAQHPYRYRSRHIEACPKTKHYAGLRSMPEKGGKKITENEQHARTRITKIRCPQTRG